MSGDFNVRRAGVSQLISHYEQIGKAATDQKPTPRIADTKASQVSQIVKTGQGDVPRLEGRQASPNAFSASRSHPNDEADRVFGKIYQETPQTRTTQQMPPGLTSTRQTTTTSISRPTPPIVNSSSQKNLSPEEKLTNLKAAVSHLKAKSSSEYLQRQAKEGLKQEIGRLSGELADLRLETSQSPTKQISIEYLQKDLHAIAGTVDFKLRPQVKLEWETSSALAKSPLFQKEGFAQGFKETVSSLCRDYSFSEAQIQKECQTLDCNRSQAEMRGVKRLLNHLESKAETTGFPLSVITAVEMTSRKQLATGSTTSEQLNIGSHTIHVEQGKALILGKKIGAGSYKDVFLASEYFFTTMPGDKNKLVAKIPQPEESEESKVQPKEKVVAKKATVAQKNIEAPVLLNTPTETEPLSETIYSTTQIKPAPLSETSDDDIDSGTTGRKPAPLSENVQSTIKIDEMDIQSAKRTLAGDWKMKNVSDLELLQGIINRTLNHNEFKSQFSKEEIALMKEKSADLDKHIEQRKNAAAIAVGYVKPSGAEEFQNEIAMNQKFSHLPGIEKIHSVMNSADGNKIILGNAAGVDLPAIPGRTAKRAVDLSQMAKLAMNGQLTKAELQQYNKAIIGAMTGLVSIHTYTPEGSSTPEPHINRDVKPENMLIWKGNEEPNTFEGTITDFGSVVREHGDPAKSHFVASILYASPENMRFGSCDDLWTELSAKTDTWSIGMSLHEFYVGYPGEHIVFSDTLNETSGKLTFELNYAGIKDSKDIDIIKSQLLQPELNFKVFSTELIKRGNLTKEQQDMLEENFLSPDLNTQALIKMLGSLTPSQIEYLGEKCLNPKEIKGSLETKLGLDKKPDPKKSEFLDYLSKNPDRLLASEPEDTRLQKLATFPKLQQRYMEAYPEPANKQSLEHLIWSCLRVNPEERPTSTEVVKQLKVITADPNFNARFKTID